MIIIVCKKKKPVAEYKQQASNVLCLFSSNHGGCNSAWNPTL